MYTTEEYIQTVIVQYNSLNKMQILWHPICGIIQNIHYLQGSKLIILTLHTIMMGQSEGICINAPQIILHHLNFIHSPPCSKVSQDSRDMKENSWTHGLSSIVPMGLNLLD